jgi:hypothetical protein
MVGLENTPDCGDVLWPDQEHADGPSMVEQGTCRKWRYVMVGPGGCSLCRSDQSGVVKPCAPDTGSEDVLWLDEVQAGGQTMAAKCTLIHWREEVCHCQNRWQVVRPEWRSEPVYNSSGNGI